MKRLVLLGEGHGEVHALPILVGKILLEKDRNRTLFVDKDVIRFASSRVLRPDKTRQQPDYTEWIKGVTIAARRSNAGAVLAVYDGDLKFFPPGSNSPFCAAITAKSLAAAAAGAGAGKNFSLSVVFACVEYETWLVAGAESFKGRFLSNGRLALSPTAIFPPGDPESHGKRWLEHNCPNYRPSRDQSALTELLDLQCVRSKNLRSFQRFEHALDQLLEAAAGNSHISTPG